MEKKIIDLYFENEKQIEEIIENKYETLKKKIMGLSEYCQISKILDEHLLIKEVYAEVFELCGFVIREEIEKVPYSTEIKLFFEFNCKNYKISLFYGSHDLTYVEDELKDLIIDTEKEKFCKSVKNIVLHCFQRCKKSQIIKIWENFEGRHYYYESEDFYFQ